MRAAEGGRQDDDGLAVTEAEAVGDAVPVSEGDGDALWDGEGDGDVLPVPEGDGDGDALPDGEGDGDAEGDPEVDGDADGAVDLPGWGDFFGAADLAGNTVAGGEVVRNSDSAGVRYAFGAGAAGRADDSGLGVTDTCDAEAGVVCDPPACDWVCGISDRGPAPVKAKTAAAEAATRPPVMQADASGRDKRRCACRATLPASG
jgi:hypothetical protein